MKKTLLFITFTIFFSFLIFLIKGYFLEGEENYKTSYIEEKYIDPSLVNNSVLNGTGIIDNQNENLAYEKIINHFNSASKLYFVYIPDSFSEDIDDYSGILGDFFSSEFISDKLDKITVEFYEKLIDVRGKMKNMTIKLYGIQDMEKQEFLGVGIHEFAHYIDLYFLEKKVFKDLSSLFYEISWEQTKVLKPGQKQTDFVSGYAMTNKYEDFAESFTYYILHNNDFLKKSKASNLLKEKYDFFNKILFRNNEFKNIDIREEKKTKDYYRDITKIDYNLKNFLQYLKTGL